MYSDDVMEEVWRIKDARAARYGYDVRALVRALQAEEEKSGRNLVEPARENSPQSRTTSPAQGA